MCSLLSLTDEARESAKTVPNSQTRIAKFRKSSSRTVSITTVRVGCPSASPSLNQTIQISAIPSSCSDTGTRNKHKGSRRDLGATTPLDSWEMPKVRELRLDPSGAASASTGGVVKPHDEASCITGNDIKPIRAPFAVAAISKSKFGTRRPAFYLIGFHQSQMR